MGSRFSELYAEGGPVLAALFVVSSVSWALLLFKFLQTRQSADNLFTQTLAWVARLERARAHHQVAPGAARRRFRSLVYPLLQAEAQELKRRMPLIATLAASAPLLGLLGTVLGMMTTLSALSWESQQYTETLARGVSQALITTQTGLVVALPIVLAHRFLSSRIERQISRVRLSVQRSEERLASVAASAARLQPGSEV